MTTLDGTVDLVRDRELVERCQSGDQTAFAELYGRYQRRLHRFCLRRLHAADDAEEAVQEAFTRAWRALPRFAGERRFYPWLTVIAGNVCTDMLRRRSRLVPMEEMPHHSAELVDSDIDVDEQLVRQVDLAMAAEALGHLSDRHQRVLRLREGTEWSAQRIAEVEGVAVPAVDTLLWRARQAFKREFAALSDTGGFAALLGVGVAALRRTVARAWARTASHLPGPARGPGAIAATIALTGAAIAGGSVALVGTGAPHRVAPGVSTLVRDTGSTGSSAPGETGTHAAAATGRTALGVVLGAGGTVGTPAVKVTATPLGQVVTDIGGLLTAGGGGTGTTAGGKGPAVGITVTGAGALGTSLPGTTSLGSVGTSVSGTTGTNSITGSTGTSTGTTGTATTPIAISGGL